MSTETQQQQPDSGSANQTLPDGSEPPPKPVEIELTPEELGEQPEQQKADQNQSEQPDGKDDPVRKQRDENRNRRAGKVQQYQREAQEAQTIAQRLHEDLARERGERERIAKEIPQHVIQGMAMQERALNAELALAKNEYAVAAQGTDPNKLADATAKLSKIQSEITDLEAWKRANPPPTPGQPQTQQQPGHQTQQQQPQERQQPQVQFTEPTRAWLADPNNAWFHRSLDGKTQNPAFNAAMHTEATAFAARLERQIERGDSDMELDSDEYWDAINQHMAEEFPDELGGGEQQRQPQQKSQQRRTPPMNGGRQPVAGSQRQVPGTQRNGQNNNTVLLSSDELGIVKSMMGQGALKYPHGHKQAGQRMNWEDAKRAFAVQKVRMSNQ